MARLLKKVKQQIVVFFRLNFWWVGLERLIIGGPGVMARLVCHDYWWVGLERLVICGARAFSEHARARTQH